MSELAVRLRLAVAQTSLYEDPGDAEAFRAAGAEVRALMKQARQQGADLIQFPEAALCFPAKRRLSSDPDKMAEADWSRFAWDALRDQLRQIASTAGQLGIWTVIGAQHELSGPRPHTGLYVIDSTGDVVTRYDERILSHTKATYLYEPGSRPVTFEVSGVRFGCTSGLEVHFPELYAAYEQQHVDCVLFSTTGAPDPAQSDAFATEARAHASINNLWIGYAAPCGTAPFAASGVLDPYGRWAGRCPGSERPAVTVVDLVDDSENPARPWRRDVRHTGTKQPLDDPRSTELTSF